MMRVFLTSVLFATIGCTMAQPYAIGNTARNWYDTGRMRDVPADVHYPAVADGDDQPAATGTFPVLVLGHGFVMTVDAYDYIWQHFTPLGYIIVLPTTEGGLAPDHAAFGEDLAFCVAEMQLENIDALSILFGHVDAASALLGHSMGGGAAFLGAAGNAGIQAVVTMAPAETAPSAVTAAASVLVPTLVFAASEDCVTPIGTNQQPMYDALGTCKALVNVTGGGHCYFGDDNFLCSFGELTCGPSLTITRAEQHDVVTDLATLWLDHYLRNDAAALTAFEDSIPTTARAVTQYDCFSTDVGEALSDTLRLWPSPVSEIITVEGLPASAALSVVDVLGATQAVRIEPGAPTQLHVAPLAPGTYWLLVRSDDRAYGLAFAVVR
ncbi:MAG: hypothetical protein WAU70_00745 [Flavobacteriales bacterium]